MRLDGHRARQSLAGLGRVCEFLNLTANNAGCRNLHMGGGGGGVKPHYYSKE